MEVNEHNCARPRPRPRPRRRRPPRSSRPLPPTPLSSTEPPQRRPRCEAPPDLVSYNAAISACGKASGCDDEYEEDMKQGEGNSGLGGSLEHELE